MKYFIIGLLSLFFLISCKQPKEIKDIIASFPSNFINYNIPPQCKENERYFNNDSEIISITEKEFDSIIVRLVKL